MLYACCFLFFGAQDPALCRTHALSTLGLMSVKSIWAGGRREQYLTGGFEVAGAGVYLPAPDEAFRGAVWGTAEEYGDAKGFHAGTRSSPVCAAC